MAMQACSWPDIDLIVVDPTQLLVRQAEIDGEPGYVPHPQREYRLELNDLKTAAATHGTTVLFVSQPRDKEREPVRGTGISEKVSYRVHLQPDVVHQDHSRLIVATVKHVPMKTVKHDVAKFMVYPGRGIDQARELVTVAVDLGIILRNGSWLYYGQIKVQGESEFADVLRRPGSQYSYLLDKDIRSMTGIA
jgi:RecA/RadA recombinase